MRTIGKLAATVALALAYAAPARAQSLPTRLSDDEFWRLIGDLFQLNDLGAQVLKGITTETRAFKVVRARSLESRFKAMRGALTPLVGRDEELPSSDVRHGTSSLHHVRARARARLDNGQVTVGDTSCVLPSESVAINCHVP